MITANLADGRVLNFPDGTAPEVVQATVKKMLSPSGGTAGPIVPGESISTITGKPITQAELPESGKNMGSTEPLIRPLLEAGGGLAGSVVGTGVGPLGMVAGGGLGYAGGKNIADMMYGAQPEGIGEQLKQTGRDVMTGATMEMAGPLVGKAATGLATIARPITKFGTGLAKEVLGTTTGAGPGMVEEAMKGGKAFTSAMRGKTTGSEVVDNAMGALQTLRNTRANQYTSSLAKITQEQGPISLQPVEKTIGRLMKQYNIKVLPEGGIDSSRIAMGKKGREDIAEVLDLVTSWGSKEGDNTAAGLDVLKRQLDDFYSDSSQARGFVQSLKSSIRKTVTDAVPEYGEMTKAYSAATDLIKDVESNLMMRKQGMSGRITPDQTLRRLTSAMRENFEMRKELVKMLGEKSGQDLAGEVGGYAASQAMPRGLAGKLAGGAGAGLMATVSPKFWPLLAASSPRAVGEFLKVYGSGLRALGTTGPVMKRAIGYGIGKELE